MRNIIILITLMALPNIAYAEDSVTITTYYPSPYGVYRNMRLYPSNEPTDVASRQAGTMYFNASENQLYIYNASLNDFQILGGGGGLWAENPTTHNIYNTNSGGRVGINNTVPASALDVGGDIHASGSVTANAFFYDSDAILKRNIRDLPHSLDKVLQLQGRAFNWKSNGRPDVGLIAQDVEKVFPELIATDKQSGLKSVEYGNLIAVLIEAVKEQQKGIQRLEAEVAQLKEGK
jgi:hypothetical protein